MPYHLALALLLMSQSVYSVVQYHLQMTFCLERKAHALATVSKSLEIIST